MRWQAVIALLAVVLILALTGYAAFNITTVVVPDLGGRYIEGVAGVPRYVNPLLSAYNDVDRDLVALVFNGLTVANEHGQILPDLADRWDVSEDNLSYTFYLRRDVRWHDGESLTADDVVLTVDYLRAPEFPGQPEVAALWRTVQVERLDEHTVRFTLAQPFAPFLSYTTMGILPAHLLEGVPAAELTTHPFNMHPIGTGPFAVEEITAEHALLKVNTEYYEGRAYLDEVEFKFYADYASVADAYTLGEVHGIGRVLQEDRARVLANENLELYSAPFSGYGLVFLNLDNPIFFDKTVRQALMHATNRQEIIDEILDGQGLVAHGPIVNFSWAYEAEIPQYDYDPEKARQLLEQAGWVDTNGDGIREKGDLLCQFALLTNEDEMRINLINELTRQWSEVGVKAVPQTAGVSGVVGDFLAPRNYQAVFYEWRHLPPDPDPYPQWHSTQNSGTGQNFTGYASEPADLIMEEARLTADPVKRGALYRDFQRIIGEEAPVLPLYQPVYNYAIDRRVQGVQVGPMFDYPDRFRTISQWYMVTKKVLVSEAPLLKLK